MAVLYNSMNGGFDYTDYFASYIFVANVKAMPTPIMMLLTRLCPFPVKTPSEEKRRGAADDSVFKWRAQYTLALAGSAALWFLVEKPIANLMPLLLMPRRG